MNILISCASDVFGESGPFSESLISYEMVKRLAARGHQLHVFSAKIEVEHHIPNVTLHEIGGYTLFKEGDQGLKERINWWKYSIRSYLKGRALLSQVDLVHHIFPSYPYHFSFLANSPKPFILGPMPLISKGPGADQALPPKNPSENKITFQKILRGIFNKLKNLLGRLEQAKSSRLWIKTLRKSNKLLLQLEQTKIDIPEEFHSKSIVTHYGVDTAIFEPTTINNHNPTVLFVGSLLPSKGLRYLIEAMPSVIARSPDTRLIVVGCGSGQSKLEELVHALQIEQNVKFEGSVDHRKIAPYFQQCDVFCLPTLSEAFGTVLLEAMSCAKPIVATNVGGVPDVVEHGRSGLIVPLKESKALAQAIITLFENPGLREKMGQHNRKLCEQKYDWSNIIDDIEEIYQTNGAHRTSMRGAVIQRT